MNEENAGLAAAFRYPLFDALFKRRSRRISYLGIALVICVIFSFLIRLSRLSPVPATSPKT